MTMHREMDRYLRQRGRKPCTIRFDKPGFFDKMFGSKAKNVERNEDLTMEERARLEGMEHDIKQTAAKAEHAGPAEEAMLADIQEEKVSIFHKLKNVFTREHKVDDYESMETATIQPSEKERESQEDMKHMAAIMMRWLDRLPTRAKEEFKESADYEHFRSILEKHGAARRK